jgi:phage I-like protein
MSQQINLLNPALIKQRDFLNPNNIVMTLGLLSALMLGYYGYAQKQLSLLTLQRSQAAVTLSATQAQLQQTTLLHTPHEMNKALIEQIAQLEQKETMQQQILQTVNLSSATPEKGYAALMRAFAKQSLDGLWLTSFSFDSSTEKLNINGRTLQADLVPEYISNLGNEPALKGKLFSALSMNLPKVEGSKSAALQTNIHADPSPASSEPEKTLAPKYIEFALQSVEEKTSISSESAKEEKKS